MVLWLTVMLAVVGGAFAFSMRSEVLAARNAVSLAQVRAAADGALDRTVFELLRPRTPESWKPDGRRHQWQDGETVLVTSAVDESARIDLNTGAELLLKNLFVVLGELDDAAASALVDAIVDWRDADELRRPSGAEAADYRAASSNYTPSNRPFESVGELSRVLGVTPALHAKVAPMLTVHSRQRGVNALTASRSVLLALPGATPEAVEEGYWVQVLASTSPETVAKAQATLEKQGFTADRQLVVRGPDSAGNELLKLRVGPFPDHASADRVAKRMQGSGFSGAWVVAP